MKKALFTIGFTFLSLSVPVEVLAANFSKMYVFGDSLSDTGNIFNATTAINTLTAGIPNLPPLPPVTPPSPPYDNGRFSNGKMWVDFLADSLGLNLVASTTLAVPFPVSLAPLSVNSFFNGKTANNSVNFAFGGAQTGVKGSDIFGELIPGVLTQVSWFAQDLQFANSTADSDALYVVWGGPNDYWSEVNPNPSNSVANLQLAVQSLYSLGARNFLLPNLPDLGKTPRGMISQPEEQRLTGLTTSHNQFLANSISNLSLIPDINLIPFDVYGLFNNVINQPQQFGFTNVRNSCLDITFTPCSNPDEYVFWDDRHPTTSAHQYLATSALEQLKSNTQQTPESTPILSLGLLGLGLGFSALVRNKSVKVCDKKY